MTLIPQIEIASALAFWVAVSLFCYAAIPPLPRANDLMSYLHDNAWVKTLALLSALVVVGAEQLLGWPGALLLCPPSFSSELAPALAALASGARVITLSLALSVLSAAFVTLGRSRSA